MNKRSVPTKRPVGDIWLFIVLVFGQVHYLQFPLATAWAMKYVLVIQIRPARLYCGTCNRAVLEQRMVVHTGRKVKWIFRRRKQFRVSRKLHSVLVDVVDLTLDQGQKGKFVILRAKVSGDRIIMMMGSNKAGQQEAPESMQGGLLLFQTLNTRSSVKEASRGQSSPGVQAHTIPCTTRHPFSAKSSARHVSCRVDLVWRS